MAGNSSIEWTESTWNPLTGCTKISAGCKHCYAERLAGRLQAMGNPRYANRFELTLHPDLLEVPLKWKMPRVIFVNSMSDLFHRDVPTTFIQDVFSVMNEADWHTYQVLTKRSDRLAKIAPLLDWPPHVWMGTSVENDAVKQRIEQLQSTPAQVKFLSLEPLLGPLQNLALDGIHWVIVGGESGPGARPMQAEWVRDIRDQCITQNVPFFFKQWGGANKKKAGRTLDGRTWNQMPELEAKLDVQP